MAKLPAGMLSLTYHLAYDEYYRGLWMKGDYAKCYADFGITDSSLKTAIQGINDKLGSADPGQRDALVDQWMALVGQGVKAGSANPVVLW